MWIPSRTTAQIWLNLLLSLCFLISVKVITSHSVSYTKNLMSYSAYVLFAKLFQLCWTLCDPGDLNPLGSSVHRIPQARKLGWVAMPFSRGSSRPREWSQVSCIAGRFYIVWAKSQSIQINISPWAKEFEGNLILRIVIFSIFIIFDCYKIACLRTT